MRRRHRSPSPRQAQADVVLRQHDPADAPVDVGLVAAQPEQLRGREARERPIAGERDESLEADALLDLCALGPGALVVPEDRRAEHAVLRVEADQTVHLAGEADSVDVDAEESERSLARPQPVVGVLLGPARLRGGERIRLLCGRDDLTLRA